MSLPGPIFISPINSVTDQLVGLRAFQRVTAQILSVTGTTAILEIDGHPIVAQLTSQEQASTLASQHTAQFIVTQNNEKNITLKLIQKESDSTSLTGAIANGPELAERMLQSNNLPITTNSLIIARSLLKQQLPVTTEMLKELQNALTDYGKWGEAEVDLAAAMKSAGLPVTAQSLALAARQPGQTTQAFSQLIETLSQAIKQDMPEELLQSLRENLTALNDLILKAEGKPSAWADQLKAWVEAFGRSLENLLQAHIQIPDKSFSEQNLVSLVKLQNMLEQFGQQETARSIQEFIKDIHREQLMNSRYESVKQDEWLQIGFMIQTAAQKSAGTFSPARLRIAHDASQKGNIQPITRLVLQVDLSPDETVEVALSLAGRQIHTSVKAPDSEWLQHAQEELPTLIDSFKQLGYSLKDFQLNVETPQVFNRLRSGTDNIDLMTVNIEA